MIHGKRLALLALFGSLAGCQQGGEDAGNIESNSSDDAVAAPAQAPAAESQEPDPVTDTPDSAAPSDDRPTQKDASPGKLPPAGSGLRFVGRWAAEPNYCADKAWRFTSTSLNTPAGSVCRFSKVTPVGGGYDIAAHCTAEGSQGEEVLQIRFAESSKAMLFESERIADAGLVYCGR